MHEISSFSSIMCVCVSIYIHMYVCWYARLNLKTSRGESEAAIRLRISKFYVEYAGGEFFAKKRKSAPRTHLAEISPSFLLAAP